MPIFDYLSEMCDCDSVEETVDVVEEEQEVQGDAEALVQGMIENAPDQKEQIGVILKYAANSNPNYDIWDVALQYYDTIKDEAEDAGDEILDKGDEEDIPVEEPTDDLATDDLESEEPVEEPVEGGDEEEEELSL